MNAAKPALIVISIFAVLILLLNIPSVVPGNWGTVGGYIAPISVAVALLGVTILVIRRR